MLYCQRYLYVGKQSPSGIGFHRTRRRASEAARNPPVERLLSAQPCHWRGHRRRIAIHPEVVVSRNQDFRQTGSGSNLPGLHSVNDTGKTETEIRYFLTNCGSDPAIPARAIRRHWNIANALHWVLDVSFCEGDSRVRHRTAATSSPAIAAIKPAFADGARRPSGTTTACSGSSSARFMREPCPAQQATGDAG